MSVRRDGEQQEQFDQWHDVAVGPWTGGLNSDDDGELIKEDQLATAQQVINYYGELSGDTGTVLIGQSGVRGNPRKVVDYVNPITNGSLRLGITDLTVYKYDTTAAQWQYVSNGTETTLTANEASSSTVMDVASITGFANGDQIGVMLNNGQMHMTTINGAPAGGTITLTVGLPSAANIGKQVVKAVALGGTSGNHHITSVVIPWSGQVVFTNSSDNVKIWTPGTGVNGACVDLTGTGLPANMKCNTLALYDNSLLLAGCTEAGTLFKSRFRYCAKGDLTLWNTLEAGSTDLLENFGEIMQALPLGPYLIFYRKRGISRLSIGGAGRFLPDAAVPLVGAVATFLAAVDLVDKHIVLGTKSLFWYRGGFAIENVECPIKKSIWGRTGAIKTQSVVPNNMFLLPLSYRNEVLIAYGFAGTGVLPRYHIDSGTWTTRAFDNAAARIVGYGEAIESSSASLGNIFLCDGTADKFVLYDQAATQDDGNNINYFAETKDFSHKSLKLKTDFFEVKASGSGTLTVGYSLDAGQNVTTWGTINLTSTPTRYRMYKNLTVDKIRFRFTGSGALTIHFFNFRHEFTAEF